MKTTFLLILKVAALSTVGIFPVAQAGEFKDEKLGINVTTLDDWAIADHKTLGLVNAAASKGAVVHAQKTGVNIHSVPPESEIVLLHSRHPLGTAKDNPNLILAKENAWAEGFEHTGSGYLALMKERMKLLGAPTDFAGEEKTIVIDGTTFQHMDAINYRVPGIATKQRYICTFKNGHYIYFVFSYNSETDTDFLEMMKVVQSFRVY